MNAQIPLCGVMFTLAENKVVVTGLLYCLDRVFFTLENMGNCQKMFFTRTVYSFSYFKMF